MKNPTKPSVKPINTEVDWSDTDSEVRKSSHNACLSTRNKMYF